MTSQPSLRVESVPDLLVPRKGLLEPGERLGISKITPTLSPDLLPPQSWCHDSGLMPLKVEVVTLDLTVSGSQGRAPPRLVPFAWAPHEQATGAPHDVEHVEDIDVDVLEVPRLL